MFGRTHTEPTDRPSLPVLLTLLAGSLSAVTCDLVTSPEKHVAITVAYTGATRLVAGTIVPFAAQVLERGVPLDGARLAVHTSDSNIVAVRDLDGGFNFVLDVKRRGQAVLQASFVSSTLIDAPPGVEILVTAVAAKLRIDSTAVTFHSVRDTVTLVATALDGRDELIAGAVTATRWSSTDPAVVTVDSLSGKVTTRGNGDALVVAVLDSTVADTTAFTVEQRLVAYGFAPVSMVLGAIGLDTTFVVTPLDARGNPIGAGVTVPTPVILTLNSGVATVSSSGSTGRLRSTGNGTTGIRVLGTGTLADDTLIVTVAQLATGVVITGPAIDTIEALQDTLLLLGTAVDPVGTEVRNRTITWFSLNSAVAQVDPVTGRARGVGLGTARIVAQMDAAADSVTVVVVDVPRALRISPAVDTLHTVGDTVALRDSSFNRLGGHVRGVPVAWRALDPGIASVDDSGRVAGRLVGTTLVIGTIAGGYADSTQVTVENRLAAIDITLPDTALASLGDTATVRAALTNARGATLPLGAAAWTSTDTGVVKVANGFVTARGVGFSTIYATDPLNPARADSVRITVTNAPDAITLNRVADTLSAPTLTLEYAAVVRNARGAIIADPVLRWRAGNASVAALAPNGLATALAVGETDVIAEASGGGIVRADTARLVVRNDAVSLTVSPTDFAIPSIGATYELGADARNVARATITGVSFEWSSSDTTVATVSGAGVVTGVRVGTARITARLGSLTAFSNATVTNAPDTIDIVPATLTLASVNDTVIPAVVLRNALGVTLSRDAAQWTSDNAAVGVTADGRIIAVGRGASYVRAANALNPARRDSVFVEVTNAPAAIDVLRTLDSLPSLSRTLTYTAELVNARGAAILDQAVAWAARTPSVATVSGTTLTTAVATAVGIGQTWIVASAGAVRDSALLVVANRAAQVAITPATVSLASLGDTVRLTAIARNELGNVIAGATVEWASANPAIVSVSTGGLVTAVGTGSTTVSATVDGIRNSVGASVSNAPTTVRLTSGDLTLASVLDEVSPSVDFRNALGAALPRDAVLWTSSNTNVATVSGTGLVTATGAGTATITATSPVDASRFSSITVTVTNAPVSITLNRSDDTLTALGRTLTYLAEVRNRRGDLIAGAAVAWTSSHPALVTIGAQSGTATAVATGGPATITATTANALTATALLRVTNNAVSLVLSPDSVTIPDLGGTTQLAVTALNNLSNPLPDSNIAWSTLDPTRATVSNRGLVTATTNAAGVGLARIVASANAGAAVKADTTYVTVLDAPTTVAFTSGNLTLASIGDAVSPAITITDRGGATLARTAVTWTSSAPNIAPVSNAGLVTAQGVGSATVTATSPYDPVLTSSITVTVTNAPASVTLNATAVTLTAIGRTTTFSAVVRNARGDPISGQTVHYTSNSPRVSVGLTDGIAAAVDTTPTSPATPVTITATVVGSSPAVTATAAVTVTNEPASMAVTPTSRAFTSVLETALATAAARNDLGNVIPSARIRWTTSDAAVVRFVSNGTPSNGPAYTRDTVRLRAEGVGSATVTAADSATGTIAATLAVSVTNAVASIDLTEAAGTITALQDTLVPAVTLLNGLGQPIAARDAVTWSSSSTVVATVSTTGVVTGVGVGTAYVRAASPANATVRDSLLVTVSNLPDTVTISPPGPDTMTAAAQQLPYTATVKNRRGAVIVGASVAWSSDAPAVATVDATGLVTAVGGGDARIVATSGTKADTLLMHVDPDPVNWYVNKDAAVSGLRIGTLARPFSTIQAALAVATPGDVIWVKKTSTPYGENLTVGTSVTIRAMPADTAAAGCSTTTGTCTAPAQLPTVARNSGGAAIRTQPSVQLTLRHLAIQHNVDGAPAVQIDTADAVLDFVFVNPGASSPNGRGLLVRTPPSGVTVRHTHVRQVRGYGVRFEDASNSVVEDASVQSVDTASGLASRAGIHLVGGSGNTVRRTRITGISGMDGIRLSATHDATLTSDTVSGGRHAVRGDSAAAATSGLLLTGGTTGFLLGVADTLASNGDSAGGTSQPCIAGRGAGFVATFTNAHLGGCATGSSDSAAVSVGAAGAHLTLTGAVVTATSRRAVRFATGRALRVEASTFVGPGGAGAPLAADSSVVHAGTADTVVVRQNAIARFPDRIALDLAAAVQLRADSNLLTRNRVAVRLGTTLPAAPSLRGNDIFDNDVAGAVGLPLVDALLANWWGDGRGPRRYGRSGFTTDADSAAIGDTVTTDFGSTALTTQPLAGARNLGSGASALRLLRGDGQVANAGTVFPQRFQVRLVDGYGLPVSGVNIAFEKDSNQINGDKLDDAADPAANSYTVATNASGLAQTRIKLAGGNAGEQRRFKAYVVGQPSVIVYFRVSAAP